MAQAKDIQRRREQKRAKRARLHKATVRARNAAKLGVKTKEKRGRVPMTTTFTIPMDSFPVEEEEIQESGE
jgi:hypothetical protein